MTEPVPHHYPVSPYATRCGSLHECMANMQGLLGRIEAQLSARVPSTYLFGDFPRFGFQLTRLA